MSKLLLHPHTSTQLDAIEPNRSTSYIFHGERGRGKATAAYQVAKRLNCLGDEAGPCLFCRQFDNHNFPDYIMTQPEDKPSITIEQVRQLIQALSLSPYRNGNRRIVVIDEAQTLTLEAQNALLKLIEEPPPHTYIILIAQQLETLLPTIRSRCIQLYFPPQPEAQIAQLLINSYGLPGPAAANLATDAEGAPGTAIALTTDQEASTARSKLRITAAQTPEASRFERLVIAAQLIAAKADLVRYSRLIQAELLTTLRQESRTSEKVATQLMSLERFRKHLQAKVAPRVALEQLMLEL